MIEESAGYDQLVMKLIAKIIPRWEYHISTGYGISSIYYGGKDSPLAGIGQGNRFLGDVCRDTSCLILKVLENRKLGITFKSCSSGLIVHKVAVIFVDDADIAANGDDTIKNIIEMLCMYNELYTATGGHI